MWAATCAVALAGVLLAGCSSGSHTTSTTAAPSTTSTTTVAQFGAAFAAGFVRTSHLSVPAPELACTSSRIETVFSQAEISHLETLALAAWPPATADRLAGAFDACVSRATLQAVLLTQLSASLKDPVMAACAAQKVAAVLTFGDLVRIGVATNQRPALPAKYQTVITSAITACTH